MNRVERITYQPGRSLAVGYDRMGRPIEFDDGVQRVVSKEFVRRRIDEEGNMRWVFRSGAEEWFKDGRTYIVNPDGEELILSSHSRIGSPVLRRWTDTNGTERWIDEWGDEHWLEADGTERWIDLDGTEWILLPVGKPFPSEPAAEPQ